MNIVNECPDISDDWRGNLTQTSALLGLSTQTVRRAADRGDIRYIVGKNNRRQFYGKEVKRYWSTF